MFNQDKVLLIYGLQKTVHIYILYVTDKKYINRKSINNAMSENLVPNNY